MTGVSWNLLSVQPGNKAQLTVSAAHPQDRHEYNILHNKYKFPVFLGSSELHAQSKIHKCMEACWCFPAPPIHLLDEGTTDPTSLDPNYSDRDNARKEYYTQERGKERKERHSSMMCEWWKMFPHDLFKTLKTFLHIDNQSNNFTYCEKVHLLWFPSGVGGGSKTELKESELDFDQVNTNMTLNEC